MTQPDAPPAVTVLLASYNGRAWLPEQLDSVLNQPGVRLRVVVSDDHSTDGTAQYLAERAAADTRVQVLPPAPRAGSGARNFYRLLRELDIDEGYLAFCDQDDVWVPGRLAAQLALLRLHDYAGVSSDVTAVSPSGRRKLLRKSCPQRRLDYLFESAGPGSTFVFTAEVARVMRELLADPHGPAAAVACHDWLVYAVTRARGGRWHIQGMSWVDYRQHADNELGANLGPRSALSRLRRVRESWYRDEVIKIAALCEPLADAAHRVEIAQVTPLLPARGARERAELLRRVGEFRRHPRDRAALAAMIATGVW